MQLFFFCSSFIHKLIEYITKAGTITFIYVSIILEISAIAVVQQLLLWYTRVLVGFYHFKAGGNFSAANPTY